MGFVLGRDQRQEMPQPGFRRRRVAGLRRGEAAAQQRLGMVGLERERARIGGRGLRGVTEHLPGSPEHARSEEHTSELQSLMRISYAVFCLKKKNKKKTH